MSQAVLARRRLLAGSAAGVAVLGFSSPLSLFAKGKEKPRFKIGACDWSIGHRGKVSALEFAKEVGMDGVQVCIPTMELKKETRRQEYLDAAKKYDIEICSLGIGMLHAAPFASDPRAVGYIEDCIRFMPKMNQKILLIPFFGKADIKGKPELEKEVIRRFKMLAPKAEKAGIILGIESTINADAHIRIIDAVGSPAIQVFYDTANMYDQGYDIYKEIRQLGRDRICQFHCRENNHLLGQGVIDFRKVREAIDDIGYRDWLVVEYSTVKGKSITECYKHNREFLQKIFNTENKDA